MRILQAFDFLSLPHGGGTVDIVYRLSKALASRGHDLTICTGDYELDKEYISALDGVEVKVYRSYFNRHGMYLMPGLLGFDISNYDVVHLHCYRSIQNAVLCSLATRQGVPYIIDAHGSTAPSSRQKQPLIDIYDRIFGRSLLRRARFVVAETEVGVAEWKELGADENKIRLRHPLMDTSEFSVLPEKGAFRKEYSIEDGPMVLFLGRIHKAKGIGVLVDAVGLLKDRGTDIRLVVVGEDDGFMHSLFQQVYIEQVRTWFPGYLGGTAKLAALVDADVLAQPSRNEAGARPSLEAILCGTPVIVTRDTGAGREIASFDGGLLFNYGDVTSLADAIQHIIDNPEESKGRTERAKAYIESNLSLNEQVAEYEKLYEEAVT